MSLAANYRPTIRDISWVACYLLFLYPISIDGISANYSFLMVPVFSALFSWKIRKPEDTLLLVMGFYVIIFVIAALYQYQLIDELPTRAGSFVFFMSMFAFTFIKIDNRMINAFVAAVILAALYFSLLSITLFVFFGGSGLGFEAKDLVGSQRYGFIYIMAFWLVCLSAPRTSLMTLLKYLSLFVIVSGMTLTFSRATIIALAVSLAAFSIDTLRNTAGHSMRRLVKNGAIIGAGILVVFYLVNLLFPIVIDFFDVRLFDYLLDANTVEGDLADSESSGGTRMFVWGRILDFVIRNPLTGSGYLGVWFLRLWGGLSGSAHSEYLDVLFRVGIFGFLIYIYLLYRTGKCLRSGHPALYWGFIGIIAYGFFHETFKESHGGFVLAFLLGMMSQSLRKKARQHPRSIFDAAPETRAS